jgi:AcrR family transcriptional regulator
VRKQDSASGLAGGNQKQDSERAAGKTRKLILNVALKIASRDGIDGLTIGELAKAVGMSKSGLFAHFGGKDQLQLAVLQLATEQFVNVVLKPAFKAPRGLPRIKQMFDNWLEHLNDEATLPGSGVLIAASTELDDRPGVLRDFVQQAQKDLISNIEKAAKMAVEEGQFRRDLDVEQFAWSMYSFVLGFHHFKRMLEDPKAELHLKRAFKGLLELSKSPGKKSGKLKKSKEEA